MKTTGQILKENRERKGISVNEVAIATKINVKTILAMESGDIEKLPPKTFLRGFVRAYASYLELDVDNLLSTFFEEMGSTKPRAPEMTPTQPRGNSEEADRAINPKTSPIVTIAAVAGILILVVLIVIFKNKMESYEKETVVGAPPAEIESLPAATSSPGMTPFDGSATASPSPTATAAALTLASPSPSPSPTSTAIAKPSATPSPSPTATAKPTATATPTPSPSATATPKPTATPTPTPSPTASPTATPTATATPSPTPTPSARVSEIIIEALNGVTIKATIDGEAKTLALKADQVHSIRAKKVVLDISDAGAINLTVNGADRGVPGDLGKPRRLELP